MGKRYLVVPGKANADKMYWDEPCHCKNVCVEADLWWQADGVWLRQELAWSLPKMSNLCFHSIPFAVISHLCIVATPRWHGTSNIDGTHAKSRKETAVTFHPPSMCTPALGLEEFLLLPDRPHATNGIV